MKIIKPLILLLVLSLSSTCSGQKYFKHVFEFSFEAGLTNDLKSEKVYWGAFNPSGVFIVENRVFARSSNFGASYSRYITPNFGLKLLLGKATFGFDYSGMAQIATASNRQTIGSLRTTHLELGLSLIWKTPLTSFINLLLEPSIRLHTEHETSANSIIIFTTDSFSFTNYSGIEFPIFSDNFFINSGLQVKIPLKNYAYNTGIFNPGNFNPGYYPYFIGIKLGINYQF